MKKVLIASAALFVVAVTNVHAQVKQTPVESKEAVVNAQKQDQEIKTPIKPEALPESIKATIASEDYKGWVVSTAFLVKADASEYYEVNLAKANEKNILRFEKTGKLIM